LRYKAGPTAPATPKRHDHDRTVWIARTAPVHRHARSSHPRGYYPTIHLSKNTVSTPPNHRGFALGSTSYTPRMTLVVSFRGRRILSSLPQLSTPVLKIRFRPPTHPLTAANRRPDFRPRRFATRAGRAAHHPALVSRRTTGGACKPFRLCVATATSSPGRFRSQFKAPR
jgi:hypothetical protein